MKIRSFNDNKKYGVAARNLKELLKKACKQLQVRAFFKFAFKKQITIACSALCCARVLKVTSVDIQ